MPSYIDHTGRAVFISPFPKKIISLVPSQTELLYDLGLHSRVVGITKFCIHPHEWFTSKQRVGGTKNLHPDIIRELEPDLIIANKEENLKEDIEKLSEEFPVWISDISNLAGSLEMISDISRITLTLEAGLQIQSKITEAFSKIKKLRNGRAKVCYLIWQNPFMTVGRDTFIHDMLQRCGFENVFADHKRYPSISQEEIAAKKCDFIFLSSEPYPFGEKHIDEYAGVFNGAVPVLVNGEMFSWYGSRLMNAPAYFQSLIDKLQDAASTSR
jgi:ABC-type Fe3+-hydroxamate transport system substrate-binding protein